MCYGENGTVKFVEALADNVTALVLKIELKKILSINFDQKLSH
jgi:hypothetical protein